MTKTKCDGNCKMEGDGNHSGEVKLVNVQGWGEFYYCESAIKDDQSRGFVVTVVNQELNKELV